MAVSLAVIIGFAACVSGLFTGCAAGKGTYNPVTRVYDTNATASTLVVTVEKIRATALDVFARIMETEFKANQLGKSTAAIHSFAEDIRKNGQSYLDDLTRSKVAFQAARGTPSEGEATSNLTAVLATVESLLASATAHFVSLTMKGK